MKTVLCAAVIGAVQYVVYVELRSKYAHSAATRRSRCDCIARTNDSDATKSPSLEAYPRPYTGQSPAKS